MCVENVLEKQKETFWAYLLFVKLKQYASRNGLKLISKREIERGFFEQKKRIELSKTRGLSSECA